MIDPTVKKSTFASSVGTSRYIPQKYEQCPILYFVRFSKNLLMNISLYFQGIYDCDQESGWILYPSQRTRCYMGIPGGGKIWQNQPIWSQIISITACMEGKSNCYIISINITNMLFFVFFDSYVVHAIFYRVYYKQNPFILTWYRPRGNLYK